MLNQKAFGLAGGIVWGLGLALSTAISLFTGYAGSVLSLISSVYPGYSVSALGILTGAVYGFIDGFIGCWLFAWVYNKFSKK
jgi:hypothetical protein